MPLQLYTAPYTYRGEDRCDVTRVGVKRGDPLAFACFAPSDALLWPALQHLDLVAALTRRAESLTGSEAGSAVAMMALALSVKINTTYSALYTNEMRASYRANRAAWDAFLARDRATIVCMCPRREPGAGQHHTCHRAILASILVKCGAVDCGEVGGSHEVDPHRQHRIPDMSRMVAFSGTRPPKPGTRGPQHREYELLAYRAEEVVSKLPADAVVVHGGAAGIDKVIDDVASVRGLTRWVVRPWWDAWGNVAPKVRNVYVAAAPKVWAFPSSYGTGTQHACGIAREAGCELTIVPP